MNKILSKAYKLVRNIGLAVHFMDKDIMKKWISIVIRPRLEYAGVLWSPYKKKHVWKLERLLRIETKIVPELGGMTFEERLRLLDLPTLEQKRKRGNLIQVCKLMNGMDVIDNLELLLTDEVTSRSMRGHSKMLRMGRCFKDVKNSAFNKEV